MKVKNRQLYSNDCAVAAIKNLLHVYDIKEKKTNIKVSKEGTNLLEVKKELSNYFYEVEMVSFSIDELKKVKKFTPYITIIENKDFSHYVVVYKKDKKYVYILDSLFKKSYKITYQNFEKIDAKKSIVVSNSKQICSIKSLIKQNIFIPLVSLIESIFLLCSTVMIQQIIDNGVKDALLYIFIQIMILLLTFIKIKSFIHTFKLLDNKVVLKVNKGVFSLKNQYYQSHDINEIFYRTFDAYTYKSMYLNFVFSFIEEIILVLLAYSLMIFYSYMLALLILPFLIIAIVISLIIFNKTKVAIEEKRTSEYEFIGNYKEALNKEKGFDKLTQKKSIELLKKYQEKDLLLEKLDLYKKMIFLFFQSSLICLIVLIYFTKLYDILSIGSLVALINVVSLLLQPLLNVCSEISMFSNYNLIKERLNDIIDNVN